MLGATMIVLLLCYRSQTAPPWQEKQFGISAELPLNRPPHGKKNQSVLIPSDPSPHGNKKQEAFNAS
jgi:hypothetical protein